MANRMASAIANRMAKPMRSGWQKYAPNPNPNPNPKTSSLSLVFPTTQDRIRSNGELGAGSIGFGVGE